MPRYSGKLYRLEISREDLPRPIISYVVSESRAISDARNIYIPAGYSCLLQTVDVSCPVPIIMGNS